MKGIFLCLMLILGPLVASAEALTVFAASSLRGPLDIAAQQFETKSGAQLTISYAGSSLLARQISFGAPADIFISANVDWMDWIEVRQGPLVMRRTLFGNRLVVIGHGDQQPFELEQLPAKLGSGKLAMALTEAVPAGIYGKAALQSAGLWEQVADNLAETDNVRTSLALVALGEAPFGVTYLSDARAQDGVSIVVEFPEQSHPQIQYPAAILKESPAARQFFDYLSSPQVSEIFSKAGFLPLESIE